MSQRNLSRGALWIGVLCLVGLAACGSDEGVSQPPIEDPAPDEMVEEGVTYHKDVRPLVEAKCMSCHDGSGVAPEALDFRDHDAVKMLAPIIAASVESLSMPPWQADTSAGCGDFRDDLSLTQAQIDTFSTWFDAGAALGNPAQYVAPEQKISELGIDRLIDVAPNMEVKAGQRYEPDQLVNDDFRCFVIDPELEEDRFLYGWQVKPDNRAVLHHLIVFTAPGTAGNLAEIERLEAEDEAPGYKCFGGIGLEGQGVAAAWAPGADTVALPEGTAMRIEAGTLFVVQMHYNLSEGGTGDDQSGIDMWFLPEGETPEVEGQNVFIGNLPFQVPAGVNGMESDECDTIYTLLDPRFGPAKGTNVRDLRSEADLADIGKSGCVQQDFYYVVGEGTKVWSVAPHMHLSGQHISIEVLPVEIQDTGLGTRSVVGDGGACLIDMPRWDFNWQRGYWFQEPVVLPEQGVVRLTCRYDNSGSDKVIGLGEGSGDEMCLGLLFISE